MDKKQQMFSLIAAWEKSGQNQVDFCAAHGVSVSKFGYWRTKWLASGVALPPEPGSSFIPIEKATPPKAKQSHQKDEETSENYEIIYPNGVCLRLPSLDLPLLKQLINCHV